MEQQNENKIITKYSCNLPLTILSSLFKDINSLSNFELFLKQKPITLFIDKASSLQTNLKSQYALLFNGLIDLIFSVENIIETEYFIQINYTLLKAHPIFKSFKFTINLHYISLYKTAIVCELNVKQCNRQLAIMNSIDKMHDLKKIDTKRHSKFQQSTVLIGCEFDAVKKMLFNFKYFNKLVPELCTKIEMKSDKDITEGDEVKLIYEQNDKETVTASLTATKIVTKDEMLEITLKTKEVGKSNTPSQQIDWIVRRISTYEMCVILRHSFDSVISENHLEALSMEKKIILNKMKNVLEGLENKNERIDNRSISV